MTQGSEISSDFPFKSKYVDVHGSKMHYVEQGQGDPILFMHGIPTSSYLWRNIIPYLSPYGRCIAVDLIGLGKSDKPDISYRVFDHIKYIEGFIKALKLERLTLVLQGWGSLIGFDYAMRYPNNVQSLAFMESHIRAISDWAMVSLPLKELCALFNNVEELERSETAGKQFVSQFMPRAVLRKLGSEEIMRYEEPFTKPGSSKPIWQCLRDLPIGDDTRAKDVTELIDNYSKKLRQSSIPKLMLYAIPGYLTTVDTIQWAKEQLPQLKLVYIGEGLHYMPETNPVKLGTELAIWYNEVMKGYSSQKIGLG